MGGEGTDAAHGHVPDAPADGGRTPEGEEPPDVREDVRDAVAAVRPDVIVHLLTALPADPTDRHALAAGLAVTNRPRRWSPRSGPPAGTWNVADDEPLPAATRVRELAAAAGAPAPRHVPARLARRAAGEDAVRR